jgi:uncharacterized membrane protein YeaQ/YmgE (transglycosylase-associated protein family)
MDNWKPSQVNDFNDLSSVVDKSILDFRKCGDILAKEINKRSRKGIYTKVILIILGALVATKGIVDQLMVNYESNKTLNHIVLIIFTLIGLVISIVAGFEVAFKYAENAAGLRILSARVQTSIRRGRSVSKIGFHDYNFQAAMEAIKKLILELDDQLKEIYDSAASFGLDLASRVNTSIGEK